MKTIAKKKVAVKTAHEAKPLPVISVAAEGTDFPQIPLKDIVVSPLNYRKYFDPKALEEFAVNLATYGVISPVMLRPVPSGSYELIVGERRYRGALIAGLQAIPAIIKELSDELVNEIQLSENLQRENPHPFHEAQAVSRMQQTGKSVEEIAARLGKSKTFVYSRIKLSGLIEPLQDIFLADKATIQEAYDVATLSPQSQYDFYEEYCTDWQDEDFEFPGKYAVNRFRYDLTRAPFDTKDKKLVAEKGACTNCPLNSATLKTLFPDMAKEAVCSGAECYHNKCQAYYTRQITQAAEQLPPQALVYANSSFFDEVAPIIESLENLKDLPRYTKWTVQELKAPTPPDKADYTGEGEEAASFDDEAYTEALNVYNSELDEYQAMINSGQTLSGLLITDKGVRLILFALQTSATSGGQHEQVTAKDVQAAIKDGTITAAMIEAEIERLNARETRYQEIDREKVQAEIHRQFLERLGLPDTEQTLTAADMVAVRLIVFQSLGYTFKNQVAEALGLDDGHLSQEAFFSSFANLTDAQFAYMLRMALAGNPDSKNPGRINGWCLASVAEAAGLDLEAIKTTQQETSDSRSERLQQRIKDLEKRKAKLDQVKLLQGTQAAA
jgi:ParB/RepB/Spo0J family partition protein